LFGSFLLLGSIPALVNHDEAEGIWTWIFWAIAVVPCVVPLLTVVAIINHLWGYSSVLRFLLGICLLCGLNFLLDVVFVKTTRWALGFASKTRQLSRVIVAILLDVVLGYGVIVGPILLGVYIFKWFHSVGAMMSFGVMLVFALKSIDFLIAIIVLIILALIGIHWVFWFVLERPIYSCLRFKIIRDKKLLWSLIAALYAAPHVGGLLDALLK
jgi:hypothetical protein